MNLGECLTDRQGNLYRVDSVAWDYCSMGYDSRLTVELTPVKERGDMYFTSAAGLSNWMRNPPLAPMIGSGHEKENGMDNEKKYFHGLSSDVKKREFNEDLVKEFEDNLALFHECVMKTEDVSGVYVEGRNTTVKWADGSHTTVHCGEEDPFDLMLGFLLCVAKRHFGGTGRYLEVMRKHGIPETPRPLTVEIDMSQVGGVYFCA